MREAGQAPDKFAPGNESRIAQLRRAGSPSDCCAIVMNTAATLSSSGTGPSPDALAQLPVRALAQPSSTTLRSELDARLLALENALDEPGRLRVARIAGRRPAARVAMDEAEAVHAARHLRRAVRRAGAGRGGARGGANLHRGGARTTAAALHRDLDTTRANTATLQREVEESRTRAQRRAREPSRGAAGRTCRRRARQRFESERTAIKSLRREVEQAQAALAKAEDARAAASAPKKPAAPRSGKRPRTPTAAGSRPPKTPPAAICRPPKCASDLLRGCRRRCCAAAVADAEAGRRPAASRHAEGRPTAISRAAEGDAAGAVTRPPKKPRRSELRRARGGVRRTARE